MVLLVKDITNLVAFGNRDNTTMTHSQPKTEGIFHMGSSMQPDGKSLIHKSTITLFDKKGHYKTVQMIHAQCFGYPVLYLYQSSSYWLIQVYHNRKMQQRISFRIRLLAVNGLENISSFFTQSSKGIYGFEKGNTLSRISV